MTRLSDNHELQELLQNLAIEDYLDYEGVDYRRRMGSSGPQLNLRCCPACGHSDWKVYIGAETGLGNCFHANCELNTFNKYKFIRAHLGNAPAAQVIQHIRTVAAALGWRPKRKTRYVEVERPDLVLPAHIPLPDVNGDVLPYLLMRGVDAELCAYFKLAYCHSGCFSWNEHGFRKFQDYSQRVIIPVFDMQGKLATFQGRDITGLREPKYLFPPGLQSSGSLLYNGHNAWGVKRLVVGEGVFDVIALKKALDEEITLRDVVPIGTFGMHLADDQLNKFTELWRDGLEEVTLMWDGEKPAIQAALEAARRLRGIGLQIRVALLPKGKDPNEIPAAQVREAFMSSCNLTTPDGMRKVFARVL